MKGARILLCLLLAGLTLLLTACGDLFDREYVSVTDYEIPSPEPDKEEAGVTVLDEEELRQFLIQLLDDQETEGRIVFDADYTGDINADIASVCWQVRTQDALYAYCVSNISYELNKLGNHTEGRFSIGYTEAGRDLDQIVRMQLTTGLEQQLRDAIQRGDSRLVVLIGRSSLSAEDVETLASKVYRENPMLEPREPRVTVNMLSGTGLQRLYEINFAYGMNREELQERRALLQSVTPFEGKSGISGNPAMRALLACEYLTDKSSFAEDGQSDIYSALTQGKANSEGLALAYVELCRQLEVPCQIVYGQKDWNSHCWNIIEIGEACYHVDISLCCLNGPEKGFLLPDETMWSNYRWDISSYPPCTGPLRFDDLVPKHIPKLPGIF
ncbi:MAG: transglutaminase domain-containing protein [Oscillospiraceae bacterium]|nr:transglutaminase domain-containing protein [Oscillospiraceae bacterium]